MSVEHQRRQLLAIKTKYWERSIHSQKDKERVYVLNFATDVAHKTLYVVYKKPDSADRIPELMEAATFLNVYSPVNEETSCMERNSRPL